MADRNRKYKHGLTYTSMSTNTKIQRDIPNPNLNRTKSANWVYIASFKPPMNEAEAKYQSRTKTKSFEPHSTRSHQVDNPTITNAKHQAPSSLLLLHTKSIITFTRAFILWFLGEKWAIVACIVLGFRKCEMVRWNQVVSDENKLVI